MPKNFVVADWAKTSAIYEVNIRQYTPEGTFAAFEKELPRLKAMGVQTLWFMPITPIGKEKRKDRLGSYYACSDYTFINPEFGSLKDFKSLVDKAHLLGFKVLIDWIANHTAWDHRWTVEHPDFYARDENENFTERNGWDDVIDLDYTNKALWKAMIKAMQYWVDVFDIDGFRCDMAHLVPLDFWYQARLHLEKTKKLFWLAECEVPAYHAVFDATYAWQLLHTMEDLYKGRSSTYELKNVLNSHESQFPANALRLYFTSNHDENSHSGSEYERLGKGALAFAVLCFTWKNSLPLIYTGQEFANTKQLLFFEKDEIDRSGGNKLHYFYQSLLQLRTNPAMASGDPSVSFTEITTANEDKLIAFVRRKGEHEVFVAINLSPAPKAKMILPDLEGGKYISAFTGLSFNLFAGETIELQPWEYLVFAR
ncbi:MAG: 1,4-alpha-glucan branching enzyme [Segetibacter sp.]|nr:1,4-alpha-glucan branching enzyme [Segetibacter sp.]